MKNFFLKPIRLLQNQQGLTLVELMIALGITGVLSLGTMALMDNMQRSKQTSYAQAAQGDIRSLIFNAVRNPANCPANVISNLTTQFGTIPSGQSVSIQIYDHVTATGHSVLVRDGETYDGTKYTLNLSGTYDHDLPSSPSHPFASKLYHGMIAFVGDRKVMGTGTTSTAQLGSRFMTVQIPITFELDAATNTNLVACTGVSVETNLAGSFHSVFDCSNLGGTTVWLNGTGRVCVVAPINFTTNVAPAACTGPCADFGTNQCKCASSSQPAPTCPVGPPTAIAHIIYPDTNYYCQYASPPVSGCTPPYNPVPVASPPAPGPYTWCELPASFCTATTGATIGGTATNPTCNISAGPGTCPPGTTFVTMSGADAICNISTVLGGSAFTPPAGWTVVPAAVSPYTVGTTAPYSSVTIY